MLRYLTAGESHGPALVTIVEGLPAGLPVAAEEIDRQLARRQGGYGRGGRMKIERDQVKFLSGLRGGLTLGTPVSLLIENRDWPNWETVMAPSAEADLQARQVHHPRPGHADLPGGMKYGHRDLRNILERSSARETAARVAAGTLARLMLANLGIELFSHVVRIGEVTANLEGLDYAAIRVRAAISEVSCADHDSVPQMKEAIDLAKEAGDSLGGAFEVIVTGLPAGLGSHVQWDRRLDGRLAQAVMSIQAIKGVEIGLGFSLAGVPGSQAHDEIFYDHEQGYYRQTNRAGGLEGGMTNGEPLVIRAAMKPIPTLYQPLRSVNINSKEPYTASVERSDTCAVPAAGVIAEAVIAFELAVALLAKFPGDILEDLKTSLAKYHEYLRRY